MSLAAYLKPYLIEAVRKVAAAEADDPSPAAPEVGGSEGLEERRACLEKALLQARQEIESTIRESPPASIEDNAEELGPMPAAVAVAEHQGGMLTLDDYKQLRVAGADMQPHFTRHRGERQESQDRVLLPQ